MNLKFCLSVCAPHPLMDVLNAHQVAVLSQTKSIRLWPRLGISGKEITFILIFPPAWFTLTVSWGHKAKQTSCKIMAEILLSTLLLC